MFPWIVVQIDDFACIKNSYRVIVISSQDRDRQKCLSLIFWKGRCFMRITFYDARISDNKTMLVKEKAVNYETEKINSPKKVAEMMKKLLHLEEMAEEYCYMIAQSNSCRVLGVFFISKGTVNASLVSPREIFIRALLVGAVHIVLCHNHPSGDAAPSKQDIAITKKIKEAGELLDVVLADHIIIGGETYFSFHESSLL